MIFQLKIQIRSLRQLEETEKLMNEAEENRNKKERTDRVTAEKMKRGFGKVLNRLKPSNSESLNDLDWSSNSRSGDTSSRKFYRSRESSLRDESSEFIGGESRATLEDSESTVDATHEEIESTHSDDHTESSSSEAIYVTPMQEITEGYFDAVPETEARRIINERMEDVIRRRSERNLRIDRENDQRYFAEMREVIQRATASETSDEQMIEILSEYLGVDQSEIPALLERLISMPDDPDDETGEPEGFDWTRRETHGENEQAGEDTLVDEEEVVEDTFGDEEQAEEDTAKDVEEVMEDTAEDVDAVTEDPFGDEEQAEEDTVEEGEDFESASSCSSSVKCYRSASSCSPSVKSYRSAPESPETDDIYFDVPESAGSSRSYHSAADPSSGPDSYHSVPESAGSTDSYRSAAGSSSGTDSYLSVPDSAGSSTDSYQSVPESAGSVDSFRSAVDQPGGNCVAPEDASEDDFYDFESTPDPDNPPSPGGFDGMQIPYTKAYLDALPEIPPEFPEVLRSNTVF